MKYFLLLGFLATVQAIGTPDTSGCDTSLCPSYFWYDGYCDSGCNNAECNYDGTDCYGQSKADETAIMNAVIGAGCGGIVGVVLLLVSLTACLSKKGANVPSTCRGKTAKGFSLACAGCQAVHVLAFLEAEAPLCLGRRYALGTTMCSDADTTIRSVVFGSDGVTVQAAQLVAFLSAVASLVCACIAPCLGGKPAGMVAFMLASHLLALTAFCFFAPLDVGSPFHIAFGFYWGAAFNILAAIAGLVATIVAAADSCCCGPPQAGHPAASAADQDVALQPMALSVPVLVAGTVQALSATVESV